jgi:hypothetical protein
MIIPGYWPDELMHLGYFLTIEIQISDVGRGQADHALLNLETVELILAPTWLRSATGSIAGSAA